MKNYEELNCTPKRLSMTYPRIKSHVFVSEYSSPLIAANGPLMITRQQQTRTLISPAWHIYITNDWQQPANTRVPTTIPTTVPTTDTATGGNSPCHLYILFHTLLCTNTEITETNKHQRTSNNHAPLPSQFRYKDNTKSSKIQIFLHYFCIFFISQW